MKIVRETTFGKIIHCDSIEYLRSIDNNSIDLIVTSPPFDLITQKKYGNLQDEEYQNWLLEFGHEFFRVLKDTGSLVMDLSGGWTKGYPTKNLSEYRVLLNYCDKIGFSLAQDFFWWDPSKLPTPVAWVNVKRVRVKDAVNKIWWFSKTQNPKADNNKVLQKYSASMELVLEKGTNTGKRSSGHEVSDKFKINNRGSIPPNLIAMANSNRDEYLNYCKENNLTIHPARFSSIIPEFFIRMLTDENDSVLDPFAGSCVTGYVAEKLKRNWVCCDKEYDYLLGAFGRFQSRPSGKKTKKYKYEISAPSFEIHEDPNHELLIKQKQFKLDV